MARRARNTQKPAEKTEDQGKLMPFKVVRTPKIRDSERNYVRRGETAMLTKALAEHYHEKGFIQVSMEGVFDDKSEKSGADGSATTDGGGPEPDQSAGSSDEGAASEDASSDAGEGETEDGAGVPPVSRRRRTTS